MTPRRSYKNLYSIWRLGILRTAVALIALVLIGRLFALQVLQHEHYAALASIRMDSSSILTPERGRVLVQDKALSSNIDIQSRYYPVAINRTIENLVISPKDIADDNAVAATLAQLFGLDQQQLLDGLKNKQREYWLIKKSLLENEVFELANAKKEGRLPQVGIWLEQERQRYYPEGEFLSQVLGFVGFVDSERKGVYGLERSFEEVLAGRSGHLETTNSDGSLIGSVLPRLRPAVNGSTLVLTIDRAIQTEVERVLKEYIEKFSADGGTIIVADPKTGAVLAMASEPQFNPNEYSKVEDIKSFLNPAVQSRYEPGSVMKPITMAIGLESGKIKSTDTYEDMGFITIDGHVIKNSDEKIYGLQTMTQILEKSLNTGAVYVQQKAGKESFKSFLEKFGFKEKTGIALPGEIAGDLRNLNSNSDIAYATASFGQGISVTPAEIVQAFTALANHGTIKKLHLVSEIIHADGTREVVEPQVVRRVVSAKTAAEVSSMMINVVENGHGKRAAVPGYYIAGKTGTAQVPLEGARGYDPDKTIGSFIGFGPVENPAFVMLVKIDNPKGIQFAESTAAPAFGEIAKFILNYLQIPPTR